MNEIIVESPKLERTGGGADTVHVIGPENSRGLKLVAFENLFGLQDIYENDEGVRTQVHVGSERSDPDGTVVKRWKNQVDVVTS